jgi:hypothetical protein
MFIKACTPKAVNHRLTNLKKSGSMTGKPPAGGDASSSANTTPKGGAKRGRRSKKAVSNDGELAIDEGDAGPETPTPAKKRGRGGKKTVANDEESDIGDQHERVFEDMGESPTLTPAKKRSRKLTVKNAGEDDDEQFVKKKIKREGLEGESQDEGYEMAENLGLGLDLGHHAAGERDLDEV